MSVRPGLLLLLLALGCGGNEADGGGEVPAANVPAHAPETPAPAQPGPSPSGCEARGPDFWVLNGTRLPTSSVQCFFGTGDAEGNLIVRAVSFAESCEVAGSLVLMLGETIRMQPGRKLVLTSTYGRLPAAEATVVVSGHATLRPRPEYRPGTGEATFAEGNKVLVRGELTRGDVVPPQGAPPETVPFEAELTCAFKQ